MRRKISNKQGKRVTRKVSWIKGDGLVTKSGELGQTEKGKSNRVRKGGHQKGGSSRRPGDRIRGAKKIVRGCPWEQGRP